MSNNYQGAKVVSIVTRESLARIESVKRKQQLGKVNHDKKDWVNVSYENRDYAKRVGCRWCPIEKKWYASAGMSSKAVEFWINEQTGKKNRKRK